MAGRESRTDDEGPVSVGISQTQGRYPRGKICSCWHVDFTPPVIAGPPSCVRVRVTGLTLLTHCSEHEYVGISLSFSEAVAVSVPLDL